MSSFRAIVKVLVAAAFRYLRLVVELDFIHQQARKALRLAVGIGVVGRHAGKRVRGCSWSGRRGIRGSGMGSDFDHLRSWLRFGHGLWRCMFGSVSREGIRERTDGLHRRRDWRRFHAGRGIAEVPLHLLRNEVTSSHALVASTSTSREGPSSTPSAPPSA